MNRADQTDGRVVDFFDDPAVLVKAWMPLDDWAANHPECGFTTGENASPNDLIVLVVGVNPALDDDTATEVREHMELLLEHLAAELVGVGNTLGSGFETIVPTPDEDESRDPFVVLQVNAIEFFGSDHVVYLSDIPMSIHLDVIRDASLITAMSRAKALMFVDATDPDGTVFTVQSPTPGRLAASADLACELWAESRHG